MLARAFDQPDGELRGLIGDAAGGRGLFEARGDALLFVLAVGAAQFTAVEKGSGGHGCAFAFKGPMESAQ